MKHLGEKQPASTQWSFTWALCRLGLLLAGSSSRVPALRGVVSKWEIFLCGPETLLAVFFPLVQSSTSFQKRLLSRYPAS